MLVNLWGGWGWSLLGLVWGLAMAGILFKVWFVERFSALSSAVYLLMGWIVLIAIKPMLLRVPHSALVWLLLGGVLYTVGVVFYARQNLRFKPCHLAWLRCRGEHLPLSCGALLGNPRTDLICVITEAERLLPSAFRTIPLHSPTNFFPGVPSRSHLNENQHGPEVAIHSFCSRRK